MGVWDELGNVPRTEIHPAYTCLHEVSDGNRDDPSYAYCGLRRGHAGVHGAWLV